MKTRFDLGSSQEITVATSQMSRSATITVDHGDTLTVALTKTELLAFASACQHTAKELK